MLVAIIGLLVAARSAAGHDWIRAAAVTLIVLGVGANILVMVVNNGLMPVKTVEQILRGEDNRHTTMDRTTRLAFWATGLTQALG